jgi:hypothetical protein
MLGLIGVVVDDRPYKPPRKPDSSDIDALESSVKAINRSIEADWGSRTLDEKSDPTMADFRALRNGMTYLEAWDVLGGSGELTSENTFPDGMGGELKTELYTWSGFGWSVMLTFQNNALMSKSQFGLE